MPTNTSKQIIAFGADHIVKLATQLDKWRDLVRFNDASEALKDEIERLRWLRLNRIEWRLDTYQLG